MKKSHISRDDRYHVQAGPPRQLVDLGLILFGAPMTSLLSNNQAKNRWTVLHSIENTYKWGL